MEFLRVYSTGFYSGAINSPKIIWNTDCVLTSMKNGSYAQLHDMLKIHLQASFAFNQLSHVWGQTQNY